ncbi:MAG: phosphate acyltransferase, partial [Lachnospiraceae bacterium]|nr:phosphate acyltransferase [Lachnospiraceae bacterium]
MEKIRVAVDAAGGDNAPSAPVRGAVHALREHPELEIIFLGDEEEIRGELKKAGFEGEGVRIIHCTEKIEMAEPPVIAISNKKDSSIVKGMTLVRKKEAEAFVSSGSTGAILVGGQVIIGRIRGVERPAIGALLPTEKGVSLLIDSGASVDARATWLLQYAQMGSIYMEKAMGKKNPTVGIVNIGAEEEKGNALV